MTHDGLPQPSPLALTRRKSHLVLGILGLAAVVILAGGWSYRRWDHVTETDARIRAEMVTVASRVDGWVAERPVTDGQAVRKQETLIVIDQRGNKLQLEQLRAKAGAVRLDRERNGIALGMAEITLPSAVAQAESHRTAIAARYRAAASAVEQTRADYERTRALMADKFASRQVGDQRHAQFQQAEENAKAALADLQGAEAALADARTQVKQLEVLRKEIEGLEQAEVQIQAEIRANEMELADRAVKSPIDGIVDEKFVEPGEYIIPGQRLFIIHNPKTVWVAAYVKETKLASLKPGQPVNIKVDAYSGRSFMGRIERIGSSATSEFALLPSPNPSGNFTKIAQRVPVRIAVEQPEDNPLRPGMMVEVDIDTGLQ